ncbi:MAG TPA: DMT family transporter [Pyrinomonadaceae bacterium]|jgi:drug/metabolite transporter (DMT)-like permease|nr:DMT family transporter [Pyrinomonadaceae bacterium]
MKTPVLTGLALVAFAANSVLCRLALGGAAIDAASFTTVRLTSGALALLIITASVNKNLPSPGRRVKFISAWLLFLYAAAFSFAYTKLTTGTGALILFGSVQATMLAAALRSGERPHPFEWAGLALALCGLVYLVLPGLAAPPPLSSAFMAVAGVSWGLYSLRGRGATDPLADTTSNFLLALPLAFTVNLITMRGGAHVSTTGVLLAVLSGALASGVGYVVWYAALRGLTATRAATVQLPVPVLAAVGGVLFMSESVSLRLLLAAALILGGVALALFGRAQPAEAQTTRRVRL